MVQKFLAPSRVRHDPDIAFGLVVFERHVEVADEPQNITALPVEADKQVELLHFVARSLAGLGGRVGGEPLGHQLSVANPDRVQSCGIEVVASVGPGIFDQ